MTEQFRTQSPPAHPRKLNPDFRHRLSILGDEATAYHVADAVERLAAQAKSLIVIIQDQLIEADERGSRLSDQIIYDSLDAVAGLVADMKAICQAHHQATRSQANGGKEGAQ